MLGLNDHSYYLPSIDDLIYAVEIKCLPIFRDVRRLVVALSRARLGLYVVARSNVFMNCFELTPAFKQARLLIFKLQIYLIKHFSYALDLPNCCSFQMSHIQLRER